MTSLSHINALERRHEELEDKIGQEMRHPSLDQLKLQEMKRKKLELKDQISRLQKEVTH